MKRIIYTLLALLFLFLFWLFRPGLEPPVITIPKALPDLDFTAETVEHAIRQRDDDAGSIKTDNHSRIYWQEPWEQKKAPCSIVYIHGFTASYAEGDPFHRMVAESLGCHLYLPRLHAHGLETKEPLLDMNADSLLADAGHALATAHILGDKVIIIGNSMGGLLATHLAAAHPEAVDALVLLSPLFDFAMDTASLFDSAWGQRLMRLRLGGRYLDVPIDHELQIQYWYTRYRIESLMTLKTLKKTLLSDELIFQNIHMPVFVGYYYEDEENQDELVSVDAIINMETDLGTPPHLRKFMAFPEAGEHVLTSQYRTDGYGNVAQAVSLFLEKTLLQTGDPD